MAKRKKKKTTKPTPSRRGSQAESETRASEALTVFWSMTVLMTLVANLMTLFAHFYLQANPEAEKMALLKGLLLFTGCLVGAASLVALPILYRIRRVPPPSGLAVFGACVAVAPLLTVLVGALQ